MLYLLPSIKLRAELLATAHPSIRPLSREWFEEVERLTDRAFELHRQRRGAEHWRCPCAKAEQLSA